MRGRDSLRFNLRGLERRVECAFVPFHNDLAQAKFWGTCFLNHVVSPIESASMMRLPIPENKLPTVIITQPLSALRPDNINDRIRVIAAQYT